VLGRDLRPSPIKLRHYGVKIQFIFNERNLESPAMLLTEQRNRAGFSSPACVGVHLMGKGLLLWLIGVPIPIIILIALFYH
jgi:hypothetical protein